MSELLTSVEQEIIQDLGDIWSKICQAVGDGTTRRDDLREIVTHIHALQYLIMSQAAARAYPQTYRLLGETTRG